jgi:hypothetical protein
VTTAPIRTRRTRPTLVTFASLSKRSPLAGAPRIDPKTDSSSSSRDIARLYLATVFRRCVHSQSASTPSGQRFHPPTSRSALAVSHDFDGLLRTGAVGLLRPTSGSRFAAFPVSSPTIASDKPKHRGDQNHVSQQRGSHPSKGSPRLAAVPYHYGRCPLVVAASLK